MPKVNITDKNGLVVSKGTGLFRNSVPINVSGNDINDIYLNSEILDISGANSAHVVCPTAGTLVAAYGVLRDGTPGGNTNLAITIAGSAVATLTLASADTSGTVASNEELSTAITAGQDITVASNGGASSARPVKFTLVVRRS